jgi:hypothetical protein
MFTKLAKRGAVLVGLILLVTACGGRDYTYSSLGGSYYGSGSCTSLDSTTTYTGSSVNDYMSAVDIKVQLKITKSTSYNYGVEVPITAVGLVTINSSSFCCSTRSSGGRMIVADGEGTTGGVQFYSTDEGGIVSLYLECSSLNGMSGYSSSNALSVTFNTISDDLYPVVYVTQSKRLEGTITVRKNYTSAFEYIPDDDVTAYIQ